MPETGAGGHRGDAVDRLTHDWLSGLLGRFVRAAGLLQLDRSGSGVSPSEAWALLELADGVQLTQRDLGERLSLEKSTVSRLVAGMQRRGLVARDRNPDNRRYARVVITDHGREVVNELASSMLERHAYIFGAMTPDERDALATGLSALVRAMEEATAAGHLAPGATSDGRRPAG